MPDQIAAGKSPSVEPSLVQDSSVAHFLTKPWYALGSQLEGRTPGNMYMNENAVRARAGLLHLTAWLVIILLTYTYGLEYYADQDQKDRVLKPFHVMKFLAPVIIWEFLFSAFFGMTPLAPYGVAATVLTIKQHPVWKPAGPKRFAWLLGVGLVTGCVIAGVLEKRFVALGLACTCLVLTWMEVALGFCLGCFVFNKIAKLRGQEECAECKLPDMPGGGEAAALTASSETAAELQGLISANSILVFAKEKCGHCKRAKEHLTNQGRAYHVVMLDQPEGQKFIGALVERTNQRTVPYIFIDGKFIGGASELIEGNV
eukprot:CAMPEP_0177591778 /NCGR_PEP_ID=MMETSP0419_2-20121207/8188_1 /TAXON_ID=582737 /ORGANISM="Tetraselmis sp., Strain GSL018" /LENGTH=314 /DNA_ID=CAMNT_0019082561 /DNA_START=181 /DNA_END=1125 /DNA_ORIENTATION=-